MKYTVKTTAEFRQDFKRAQKRGRDMELLKAVVKTLAAGETLPQKYRDHALTGNYRGHRECHLLPDWLLVYTVRENVLVLTLVKTGTHSDIFGK